ncbi:phage tail protein [Serinicoccus sediminis]|uniref:phage tail protein n=1 Tax=Serinicoccus sediminis TaxID=2306021 RepID=UPI0010201231|nr:phage tail protein [Serinicoccus sediminis]
MPLATGDVLASYAFEFEVEGISIAQFAQVSGVTGSIGVIEHRENTKGGKEIVKKLPGATSYGDITLRKGRTTSNALWEWFKQVQDGKINEARKNASIVLFDYEHGEVARFNLVNCWISQVRLGELAAGSNSALIEEAVIVHEGMTLA